MAAASAKDAMLSKKSLKKWDSGKIIDSDEVELLCNTIQNITLNHIQMN